MCWLSKQGVLPYLHVALALLPTDEEHKLVEAPELFLVHGLQGRKEPTVSARGMPALELLTL